MDAMLFACNAAWLYFENTAMVPGQVYQQQRGHCIESLSGRIIESQRRYSIVDTQQGKFQVRLPGNLRRAGVCAGDIVDFDVTNPDTSEGLIRTIHPRSSHVPRPPLANMDQCVVVCTIIEPELDLESLDRFLMFAQLYGCPPLIVCNKCDLLDSSHKLVLSAMQKVYNDIDISCIALSASTGENMALCTQHLHNKRSFLVGASGAGKTTLLANIFPDREFRTSPLSPHIKRGIHTTTSIQLLDLAGGGHIADTPGYSLIELPVIPQNSVISYFPDVARFQRMCRFCDCRHDNEPGCAAKDAVEKGSIASWRYEHYLKIYREMKIRNSFTRSSRAPERSRHALSDAGRKYQR